MMSSGVVSELGSACLAICSGGVSVAFGMAGGASAILRVFIKLGDIISIWAWCSVSKMFAYKRERDEIILFTSVNKPDTR